MGAWIETYNMIANGDIYFVAPRMGAWIETPLESNFVNEMASRPAWARGLKQ